MYVTTEAAGYCQLHKISQSTASEVASYFLYYHGTPGEPVTGPDGNVWFGDGIRAAMVRFDIVTHAITQFTVSNSGPQYSDGTYLWSTGDGYFQRVDMSGTITAWYITSDTTTYSITPDGSGNFWLGGANLYRVSPSGTLLATISLPGGASCRGAILGPDGLPWFGDYGNLVHYQVTSPSTFNTYTFRQSGTSPPNLGGTPAYPIWGVIGSDGNMWWSSDPTTSVTRVVEVTQQMQVVMVV
jgi:streptogramin lyase